MCTLAVALGQDRRWPVVVAANRDERLGRQAEGWALRETPAGTRYAAPRDVLAGGTWIGVSSRAVLAALTNYHAPFDWYPDPERRSRGDIVGLALAAPDASAARSALFAERAEAWNPFHLVVADAKGAFLWWYDGERSGFETLGPGLHVVTESDRAGRGPRADLVRARWPTDLAPERLQLMLGSHAGPDGTPPGILHPHGPGLRHALLGRAAPHRGRHHLRALRLRHPPLPRADGGPLRAPPGARAHLTRRRG
ncbi:MAG: NRDE family protein [Anaeromyxobacteraceae bacterium]